MLLPKIYQVEEVQEIHSFIAQHSFATVVSELHAAHIPLLHDAGKNQFVGHLTSTNPVLDGMQRTGQALAIFQGPHGYISSSSYIDQTIPPTWNFTAVHAVGRVDILNDERDKLRILRETVSRYEEINGTNWSFKADDDGIQKFLPMITGFVIHIESLQCCYKLSQNQKQADSESAIKHLEEKREPSSATLAHWMRTKAGKTKR